MTTDDEIVLVCPRHARPGQTIYYRDHLGARCATTLPSGLRPGDRFRINKPSHSTTLLGAYAKKHNVKPLQSSKSCGELPSRNQPPSWKDSLQAKDRELVDDYLRRQRKGEVEDASWWGKQGFRPCAAKKKAKDYGYGAPKWSPYYRSAPQDNPPDIAPKQQRRPKSAAVVLGDQGWWEQFGFKGSISDEKRRDYGNGVPIWSPYYRSEEPAVDDDEKAPLNLPPDAFWFREWGFRTGGVSEDKKRDYGFGVPKWSPYYRPKEL